MRLPSEDDLLKLLLMLCCGCMAVAFLCLVATLVAVIVESV